MLARRVCRNIEEFHGYLRDLEEMDKESHADKPMNHIGLTNVKEWSWPTLVITFLDWGRSNSRQIVAHHANISQEAMYVLLGIGPNALRMEIEAEKGVIEPIPDEPETREV